MIEVQKIRPSTKALDDYIEYYWQYAFNGNLDSDKQFIPEGIFEIIFDLGDAVKYLPKGSKGLIERPHSFVGGLFENRYQLELKGHLELFGVRFKMGKFRHFTNIPLHHFKNAKIQIDDAFGEQAIELSEKIKLHSNIKEREALVSKFLFQKLIANQKQYSFAEDLAIRSLTNHESCVLEAKKLKITDRHLRRVFNQEIGMPPKRFFQLKRMNSFLREKRENIPLTSKAYEFGYYDQSHFVNDLKKIIGTSPSLIKDRINILQQIFIA